MATQDPERPDRNARRALLLACSRVDDGYYPALHSPVQDIASLATVLADKHVGGYEVAQAVNPTMREAQQKIEQFFNVARKRHTLLLYLSCHGQLDDRGDLHFIFTDTDHMSVKATAVSARWVADRIRECLAGSVVVIIDCCFSGAFFHGMLGRGKGHKVDLRPMSRHAPRGGGLAVITASDSTEVSLEQEQDRQSAAHRPSFLTEAVVTGLQTGAADLDRNGHITVDELYSYAYERVIDGPSPQHPQMLQSGHGQIVVAEAPATGTPPPPPPRPGRWAARRRRRWAVPILLAAAAATTATWMKWPTAELPESEPKHQPSVTASVSPTPPGQSPTVDPYSAYSYLQKATAANDDIDVSYRPSGYLGQHFTASGPHLASVAIIVSRDAALSPGFDPARIGHVLLTLRRVDASGVLGEVVPLQPRGGEPAADGRSIRAMAGPNHKDTIIAFDPVPTRPGERFAFIITNDEPGVTLVFSLRPTGAKDGPAFWDGADRTSNAPAGRTNRAVAGYVCNVLAGC